MSEDDFSKLEWEILEKISHSFNGNRSYNYRLSLVERAKVFGGWLIRSTNIAERGDEAWDQNSTGGAGLGMGRAHGNGRGLTFIPDQNHEWTP